MNTQNTIQWIIDQKLVTPTANGHIYNYKSAKNMHESDNGRYYLVSILNRSILVHRICGYFLWGKDIFGVDAVIDHIDRNSHNNALYNLRLVTHRENMNFNRKSPTLPETKDQIRALYATGNYTQQMLAKQFGLSVPYVAAIIKTNPPLT